MKYLLILLTILNFSFNLSAQNQDSVNYELRKIYFDSLIRVSDEINLVLIKPHYKTLGPISRKREENDTVSIYKGNSRLYRNIIDSSHSLLYMILVNMQDYSKFLNSKERYYANSCGCHFPKHLIEFRQNGIVVQSIFISVEARIMEYRYYYAFFNGRINDNQMHYLKLLF